MTTAFNEKYGELVEAWTQYQDMVRGGADLDSRAQARGRLVQLRSQMARVRQNLPR